MRFWRFLKTVFAEYLDIKHTNYDERVLFFAAYLV